MSKILPLAEPLCRTYPHTAHALSILQNRQEVYPWLLNSFIQIEGWDFENMDFEDFWIFDCPLIKYQRIGKDTLKYYGISVADFIENSIDRNNYVYIVLNTAVLKAYGEAMYPHDALIYGYDKIKRIYYVADFFNGKRYGVQKISYEELLQSLELSDFAEDHWIFRNDIILIQNNQKLNGKFSPERVKMSLNAYLKGEKTQYWYHRTQDCYVRYPYKLLYGINTYKILYRHLASVQNGVILTHWRQVFHFFYEHKKTMLKRIDYMSQNGYINNGEYFLRTYIEIKNLAFFIRKQFLDFYKGCNVDFRKAEEFTKQIENIENELLFEIRDNIIMGTDDKAHGLIFLPESF